MDLTQIKKFVLGSTLATVGALFHATSAHAAPPPCTITANPSTVPLGGYTTLTITSRKANEIYIGVLRFPGGVVSTAFQPTKTDTHYATVFGPGGNSTCGVTVTVTGATGGTLNDQLRACQSSCTSSSCTEGVKYLDDIINPRIDRCGDRTYQDSCLDRAASIGLSNSESASVCNFSNQYSRGCLDQANNHSMNDGDIVRACDRPTAFTEGCIDDGDDKGLGSYDTGTLCQRANRYVFACALEAYNEGLRESDLALLCAESTPYSVDCINEADNRGLTAPQISRVCERARSSTADCIADAYARGFRGEDIVTSCRGR